MRLKIFLEPKSNNFVLPINYNYHLSSAIYKIFFDGSKEVATWLHEVGYKDEKGRKLKLFNFSDLMFSHYQVENNLLKCFGMTSFIFSAPIETNLVKYFIDGIMKKPTFKIYLQSQTLIFRITTIELQEELKIEKQSDYSLMTPATVSIQNNAGNKKRIIYLKPIDDDYAFRLSKNLKKKFKILHNYEYEEEINISIKPESIKSKLITIKEGLPQEIKVKAYLFDFVLKSLPEIHRIAYYCGIGEKNSLGFGMIRKK